ncbi:MAG: hypothetical protein HY872_06835 [Chloroflexi bacterium]|nr:hypothetical protein [Chloroflexota bacterium]
MAHRVLSLGQFGSWGKSSIKRRGTSAEALYYLEKAGFRTALSRATWAGYQRSVQLGRGKKRSQLADGEK